MANLHQRLYKVCNLWVRCIWKSFIRNGIEVFDKRLFERSLCWFLTHAFFFCQCFEISLKTNEFSDFFANTKFWFYLKPKKTFGKEATNDADLIVKFYWTFAYWDLFSLFEQSVDRDQNMRVFWSTKVMVFSWARTQKGRLSFSEIENNPKLVEYRDFLSKKKFLGLKVSKHL